jgi:hypothetical protein
MGLISWTQLEHLLHMRKQLPLSTSLWEFWYAYVALPLEEEMCCRFFTRNHEDLGKESAVLRDVLPCR